jgi:RNase P/RNase MRP subunit p30
MMDIVCPKGNEKEFIAMAKKLRYSSIGFAYKDKAPLIKDDFPVTTYALTSTVSGKKVKKETIVQVAPETNLRSVIQQMQPAFITSLEFKKHDFIHHRSGLNQVLGKLMNEHHVALALNLSFLFSTKYKAEVMGRMKHNIVLAKKYGVEVIPCTFATTPLEMKGPKELQSLMRILEH